MIDFLKEQFPTIITGLLGLGAWIHEKRKKRAELQVAESDAIKSMQNAYNTFVNDMNEKYKEQDARIDKLTKKLGELEDEVEEWKNKYHELKKKQA